MITISSGLNNAINVMTSKGSSAELSKIEFDDIEGDVFYFHRIRVRPELEGTGEGRELMIEVCKLADKLNVAIYNELNPYGKRDMDQLKLFFKDSGFIMFGDHKNNVMVRFPREKPYLIVKKVTTVEKYNPCYGNARICECGHFYYRHFDSYDDMRNIGCKYCSCCTFIEKDAITYE